MLVVLIGSGGEARADRDVGDHAGAAGAPSGQRVVVLADERSAGHAAIAEEVRVRLHRSHPGAAFELEKAVDHAARVAAGARVAQR
ncbi:MAG: hypothetical protein EOO70_03740, partial [Myxococcaceae bacterium]